MEKAHGKVYFWILIDALIVAAIINVVFFVMPAIQKFGDSMAVARTLTVSAEGKTTVSPDIAEVYFSVVSQGANPQTLSATNNDKMSAVIENIKANGVETKDIKTTGYDLQPSYSYDKNTGRSYIYSYTLTQTVTVKIRDLKKVAAIIGGVTPLGVNQIGSVVFNVENPDAVLADARTDAFNKIKAKIDSIQSASGVRVGKIITVNEYQSSPTPYYKQSGFGMGGVAAPSSAPAAIEPGSQELRLNVTVTYAIQ